MEAEGKGMTFLDLSDDLEALWYAALWFEDQPGSVPGMNVEILRPKAGSLGPAFVASRGALAFRLASTSNVSNTQL